MAPSITPTILRSLRLDDRALTTLLDRLDAQAEEAGHVNRMVERYRFRMRTCVIELQQLGSGASVAYAVPTRNLSADGICFLHGGFVHSGSRVRVQLVSVHGTCSQVAGVVVRCKHVEGLVHEVGVRFRERIRTHQFCPEAMRARVLLAEHDGQLSQLAAADLEKLGAELQVVGDGKAAVEAGVAGDWDLMIMEVDLPLMNGFEAVMALRKQGYAGTVVGVTEQPGRDARTRCLQSGFDGCLSKPFSQAELQAVLKSLRTEPLLSTLHGDPDMRSLIEAFVAELPGRLRTLELSFLAGDREETNRYLRQLKGEAGSFGFEPITSAASDVEAAVTQGKPEDHVRKCMARVSDLCCAVQVGYRARPPKPQP